MQHFDIGIIGGGPAGYTAAFQARQKGLSVVLFEKDKIGGVCLNRGCIPTKAILHSAELYEELKCASDLGINIENISVDYAKVIERKNSIVEKLRKSLELSLKNAGVTVVRAEVTLTPTPSPKGRGEACSTQSDMSTCVAPHKGRGEACSTQSDMSTCVAPPKGGGETCSTQSDMSTCVAPHKGRGEACSTQSDMSTCVAPPKGGGETCSTQSDMSTCVAPHKGGGEILANGETFVCEKIITATGSVPRDFEGLRFDHEFILSSDDILEMTTLPKSIVIIGSGAIGIEWARIFSAFGVEVSIIELAEHLLPLADIEVSKRVERIFKSKKIKMYLSNGVEKIENRTVTLKSGDIIEAECVLLAVGRIPQKTDGLCIGDSCGKIQLAHFAIKQAVAEVAGIDFDETLVPSVVYGCPEIAWVGKREQDLQEGTYKKSNLLISALGKSHCDNCTDGFIKVLSQDGKIVGAHIVAKEASALIQQITIAMQNNISIDDLKKVCFAHPTYSEGIFESLFKM